MMVERVSQRDKHFKFKEKILGQFFTPPEVSDFIVSFAVLHLTERKSACDPACGDGVFLAPMIKYGFEEIVGVDIDKNVIDAIPTHVKDKVKIALMDALAKDARLEREPILKENHFNLVAGNPPFSSKYGRIRRKTILRKYKLGQGYKSQAIEVLFLERFINLAKEGGLIGIILPDGIFLNVGYKKVREYILNNCKVLAVVSLPRAVFNSSKSTTSKTSILFAIKGRRHEGKVFMVDLGSITELNEILNIYKSHNKSYNAVWADVTPESLHPKTYISEWLPAFRFQTFKIGELIEDMFCGGTEYGEKRKFANEGLRFISAKVVTPLGIDFTRDAREFIEPESSMDKKWAHVKVGDVLFVRVGVGCIGRASVVVDDQDLGVADDWTYIIRVKNDKVSPYYLAVFLQTKYGKAQIDKAKRGVGTVTIPQRLLKEMIVPLPPMALQRETEEEYKEMVRLRRDGKYERAKEIFNEMIVKLEKTLLLTECENYNGGSPHNPFLPLKSEVGVEVDLSDDVKISLTVGKNVRLINEDYNPVKKEENARAIEWMIKGGEALRDLLSRVALRYNNLGGILRERLRNNVNRIKDDAKELQNRQRIHVPFKEKPLKNKNVEVTIKWVKGRWIPKYPSVNIVIPFNECRKTDGKYLWKLSIKEVIELAYRVLYFISVSDTFEGKDLETAQGILGDVHQNTKRTTTSSNNLFNLQ
jgi:type I restriction enzyme M protein